MKWGKSLLGLACTVSLLCTSACSFQAQQNTVSTSDLRLTDDVVLAMRFSAQLHDLGGKTHPGYIALVKADGSFQAAEIGHLDTGKISWGASGLLFGDTDNEYLLTDTELVAKKRSKSLNLEYARYLSSDGQDFVSLYSGGLHDDGYTTKMVSYQDGKYSEWDIPGYYEANAKCGNTIVGITAVDELNAETKAALKSEETTQVWMQLYPRLQKPNLSNFS